ALLTGSGEPERAIRSALRGRPSLVALDGLDVLDAAQRDQIAAALRDASRRARSGRGGAAPHGLTVLATAADTNAAEALLAEAGLPAIRTAVVTARAG